jgi:hypothetical protein
MHWPKVSDKKKQELEQLKMSLKTSPGKLLKKSPKSIVGSEYHTHNKDDTISTGLKNYKANSDKEVDKHSISRKKIKWPENSLKPQPKEKKEGQIKDWLKE